MSLRTRLFLLIGGLSVVLVVAQWWLVGLLSRQVKLEMGQVAFHVGEGIVSSLGMMDAAGAPKVALTPPPGSHQVTEREITLREINGKLEIVGENVRVSHVGEIGATAPAITDGTFEVPVRPAGAAGSVKLPTTALVLSVEAAGHSPVLKVGGPEKESVVPIPQAGVTDALADFRRRLLAGSAILLGIGLLVAALIAHRATAPLRELSSAARAIGSGALGTQVPHAGTGEVAAAVGAFNTMSKRLAELDAESRRLREREHLTEVGEIARGLAHGLRNPLNALGLTVDELAAASPERASLADSARRQIRRIDGAVRSFLALAASAGSTPAEDVDLVALVQDVALEALQDARGRVSVSVEAGDDVPRVRAVPAELRAVVQALVVNAVEASPDGARVVAILGHDGDTATLRVEDQGSGLPPSVRARIFTPHVTTKANGSGMGLYLAHRIVTARQGGSLELIDREGGGTVAVATIPASVA